MQEQEQEQDYEQDLKKINDILYDNRQKFHENDYLIVCNCLQNVWKKKKKTIYIRPRSFDIIDYSIFLGFILLFMISIFCIHVMTISHQVIKILFFGNKYYCWKIY